MGDSIEAPVTLDVAVAWGDMDAFLHVNNTVYLRWMESARIAYFHRVGMLEQMESTRVGPILARTEIDYRLPVTFPDTIRVEVGVEKVGRTSFVMVYRLTSAQKDNAVVAQGKTVIVNLDYGTGQAVPLSEALRARLSALQPAAAEAAGLSAPEER